MAISAGAQFHVLAVDDSLLDRKLIERLLRTSSYQVTTVDSGRKALELLGLQQEERASSPFVSPYHQEVEVNLVITDYCMPGMTGFDLLKRIKETSSLKNIPVVIMSSENVPSRISRCLEEGAEEFFLKPVRMSDVEKLIPHIMKKKSVDLPKEAQMELQQVVPPPEQQQQQQKQSNSHGSLCPPVHTENTPQSSSGSNKRKAMDESPTTPDRTRPRCTVTA